MQKNKRMVI